MFQDHKILDIIENNTPIEKIGNNYYINDKLANIEEKKAIKRLYRSRKIAIKNNFLIINQ